MGNESIFHRAVTAEPITGQTRQNGRLVLMVVLARLNYVNFVIFDTDLQALPLLKIFAPDLALDRCICTVRFCSKICSLDIL